MLNTPKYDLAKRGKAYSARFYEKDHDGKKRYVLTKTTGETAKVRAHIVVTNWIADGLLFASTENLREYFLTFWNKETSEYIRSKEVETGRAISLKYCNDNARMLEQYFIPWFEARGIKTIRDLNRENLLAWRNDLATGKILSVPTKGKQPKALSPVGVNKVRQAAWVALEWAVESGKLPAHPGARVARVSERKQQERSREKRAASILELAEARTLFLPENWKSTKSDDSMWRAAALFAFATGARQGEVQGLTFEQVDFEHGQCNLVLNWQDEEGLKTPKWESLRKNVYLPDIVLEALQDIRTKYPHRELGPKDFVFPHLTDRSRPAERDTLNGALKRALKRSGIIRNVGYHDLRHTWASHSDSAGVPQAARRGQLGHRSAEITDVVYTHNTEEGRKAVRRFVDGLLEA